MSIINKPGICILLISFLFAPYVHAQTATFEPKSGLDSLLMAIEGTMKKEHMPGLMLSIVTKDSILYSGGLGYSNLKYKIKADSSTLFHMQSVTKMFTALAIQKLIADGKLNLNDELRVIAPEILFKNAWEKTDPVRIVHLLEHTAGFDDVHLNRMINRSGKPLNGLKAVESISTSLTSRWRPGERMSYSNPGYVVLGYLIEKLSRKPWNEYIMQNVLLPLDMAGSFFDLNGQENPKYARGYYSTGNTYKQFIFAPPGGNGAGSALVSNANDISGFIKKLLNGWKTVNGQWLPESSLEEMEKVHSTLAAKHGLKTGYALANELFPNNKKITFRGHNGTGEGFNSWIFYNREAGIGYSICNNGNKGMWPISQLIENFLTRALKQQKPQDSKHNIDYLIPLTGYYQFTNPRSEKIGFYEKVFEGLTLSIVKNKLVVTFRNGRSDTLINTGGNVFRASNDIIPSFVLGKDKSGQPFFHGYGNGFYQRTSYAWILFQKALIFAGITAMILSVVVAFVTIVLRTFKKTSWIYVILTVLPALGVLSLIAAYRKMILTDEIDKAAFSSVNYTTIYIFLGTLGFGLLSLASIYFLYSRWSVIGNRWFRALLTLNSIFIFYMVCLLFYHGWIGVRIWSL